VVGHQAVGVDRDARFLSISPDPFQISLVIGVIEKGLLSLIPAHDHVVQNSTGKQPGASGHDKGLI